ncbi:MAG: xanthine dehydrogenase small subunit [Burkholderiaceae bacterium]|nr:xanthine dehydrogenase small subunit [Burkholderiaceae bacterium]
MTHRPLQFLRRGQTVTLAGVPPDRTLLDLLREDLGCTGTKEGCGTGDCGACTVVLGEARDGAVRFRTVNSCLRLAHAVQGQALWTVEDLAHDPLIGPPPPQAGTPAHPTPTPMLSVLHPAQQALVEHHGSQCGFCTPGFVMGLFGLYQNQVCQQRPVTRALAQSALSGNLCRCTGYRPILEAAQQMDRWPRREVDTAQLLQKLELLAQPPQAPEADSAYMAPTDLAAALAARAAHPSAQVVAGGTDVGLGLTQQQQRFERVLDVGRVAELRGTETRDGHLVLGAAEPLNEALAALVQTWPALQAWAERFASLAVRNVGTLGGNVAHGSPVGDSMPLLIALRADLVLASLRGPRTLALDDFYTGYRQHRLAPDELLQQIRVPLPGAHERLRAYKVSRRFDDDIATVALVLNLEIVEDVVRRACIGAGGVAATPARARQTEAALQGQPWTPATVQHAAAVLRAEFTPLSDLRASSAYRRTVLGHLLQRYWLDSQGSPAASLDAWHPDLEQNLDLEVSP